MKSVECWVDESVDALVAVTAVQLDGKMVAKLVAPKVVWSVDELADH